MGNFADFLDKKYNEGGGNATLNNEKKSNSAFATFLDNMYEDKNNADTSETQMVARQTKNNASVQNLAPMVSKSSESLNFPTLKPRVTDEELIAKYESIPSYGFLERTLSSALGDSKKKLAYDTKQELYPQYKEAKMREVGKLIDELGITEQELSVSNGSLMGQGINSKYGLGKYNLTAQQKKDIIDYAEAYFNDKATKSISDYTDKSVGTGIGMTALSFATNPLESAVDTGQAVVDYLAGRPITKQTADVTQNIRNTVTKDMGTVGKTIYGIGTSMGDMLIAAATGHGAPIMGVEKAASTINSASERGLSPNQIIAEGVASGLTTAITEGKVFENFSNALLKGLAQNGGEKVGKALVKQIAKGFFAEGGQEVAEGLLDTIVDQVVSNLGKVNNSELNMQYTAYRESGMSEKEAKDKITKDVLTSMFTDFIGGGVAGGLLQGAFSVGGTVASIPNANRELNNMTFGNLTEETEESKRQMNEFTQRSAERRLAEERQANLNPLDALTEYRNQQAQEEELQRQEEERRRENNLRDAVTLPRIAERMREEQNATATPNLTDLLAQAQELPSDSRFSTENNQFNDYSSIVESKLLRNYGEDSAEYNQYLSAKERVVNAKRSGDEAQLRSALVSISNIADPEAKQLLVNYANDMELPTITEEIPKFDPSLYTDTYMPKMKKSTPSFQNTKASSKTSNIPRVMAEDTGINKSNAETKGVERTTSNGSITYTETAPNMQINPDGTYVSQTAWNSINNGINANDTQAQEVMQKAMDEGQFNQKRISEDESVQEARGLLSTQEGREEVMNVLNGKKTEITGVYVDASMINLEEERVKASKTGDYAEFLRLARLISDKMHNVGQSLQALAKYTRTATGSIMQTEKLRDAFTTEYFKKAKNTLKKEKCGKLASALRKMGYDGSMDIEKGELNHQQMVERVKNTMSDEYASIIDDFEEADYEYLARLVENNIDTSELTKRMEQRIATGSWGLSDNEVQIINALFDVADKKGINSREASELLQKAYSIEAQHIGNKSFMEKWNAWRYFAMLGNPRTHIRNILGNFMFGSVTDIKDMVVATIESQYAKTHPEFQRTTSIVTKATDPELFNAADKDFEINGFGLATDDGGKYDNMRTNIEKARSNGWLIDKNSEFLEKEDNFAIKRKYVKSLASYIKANGYDASIFNSDLDEDIEFLDKAREHAVKEAKEATFHEDNKLATLLNRFSRNARDVGGIGGFIAEATVESVIPFKKTPANILKSGVDYSPLGFINAIKDVKNQKGANEVINDMSKSLTGSAILLIGVILAKAGILRASNKDDDSKAMGDQEYSLNIGNMSYTIDWTAPAALPLFVGAEVYQAIEGESDWVDALSSIAEPMIELSMLQGIQNTMKSISYGMQNGGGVTATANGVITFGTGYLSQGIPTLAGQVARAIDPYRRTTYTENTGVKGALEYQKEKAINKIPFLSMTNEAYIDEWGNKQENTGGNVLGRLIYNMTSPGYYSSTKRTDAEAEIERLTSAQTKVNGLYPSSPDKNYDGQRIDAKTYEALSRSAGKYTTEGINTLIKSSGYKDLSDVDKARVINKIENFAQALAKADNLGYKVAENKDYKRVYEVYKKKGMSGVVDYYTTKENLSTLTGGSSKQADLIPALGTMNITDEAKGEYLADSLSSVNKNAVPFLESGDYASFYQYYAMNTEANADGKNGTSQTEMAEYLRNSGMSYEERVKWFKIFFPDAKNLPTLY